MDMAENAFQDKREPPAGWQMARGTKKRFML